MFPLTDVLLSVVRVLPTVIFNLGFWFIVFIIFMQYARTGALRERMMGVHLMTPGQETLRSALYGLFGGIVGSLIFVVVGVTLTAAGLSYIWPLAFLLMILNPRFLCFSYAGGIISLVSLIFGFPRIGVPELMSLVSILHIIESLLILVAGSADAVPVFTKARDGRVVGGFVLQKFWPIPIVAMMVLTPELKEFVGDVGEMIRMPDWWPLIKPNVALPPGEEAVYAMFAIPAALGYGDIALTRRPWARSHATAFHLLAFSVVLLTLAVLSARFSPLKFVCALFSPLGHEAVIWFGRRMEFDGEPLFAAPEKGVKVLEVVPGMPAHKAGFISGDIILRLNGHEVNSRKDIQGVLEALPSYLCFDVLRELKGERLRRLEFTISGSLERLGMVFVPESGEEFYMDLTPRPLFKGFQRRR